jgi:ribose/xylose/arabinose/galactoside ABC-type transport system permease subunit
MDFQNLGKIIIFIGVFLVIFGLLLTFSNKIPFIGKLPGDFVFKRDNFSIYFPLATSIILSVILTLVLNFILRRM